MYIYLSLSLSVSLSLSLHVHAKGVLPACVPPSHVRPSGVEVQIVLDETSFRGLGEASQSFASVLGGASKGPR